MGVMDRSKWVWMPHPGHFIGGSDCKFHLSTYVGKFVVSTVGDYKPGGQARTTVGCDRLYETMVFKAKKARGPKCGCLWIQRNGDELDFCGYNDPGAAYRGHMDMCEKWSKL